MKYYDLLLKVADKPALYGVENVNDIRVFTTGIACGLEVFGGQPTDDYNDFVKFTEFVAEQYDAGSMYNWSSIITYHSTGNRDSLMTFKRLLQEYLETKK